MPKKGMLCIFTPFIIPSVSKKQYFCMAVDVSCTIICCIVVCSRNAQPFIS